MKNKSACESSLKMIFFSQAVVGTILSLPIFEDVKNYATALAGHRAAILFNFSLIESFDFNENI